MNVLDRSNAATVAGPLKRVDHEEEGEFENDEQLKIEADGGKKRPRCRSTEPFGSRGGGPPTDRLPDGSSGPAAQNKGRLG